MIRYPFPMRQNHPQRWRMDLKRLGALGFSLFIIFVAFKILTPPSSELARINSPDGKRVARLRKIYYVSQPSYKIDFRGTEKQLWLNLYYLTAYTNVPHETAVESLKWSEDSEQLFFSINGTSVWHHTFE